MMKIRGTVIRKAKKTMSHLHPFAFPHPVFYVYIHILFVCKPFDNTFADHINYNRY